MCCSYYKQLKLALISDIPCRQSEEGQGLAAGITALVNETISQEASTGPNSLSQEDVLALIDTGGSQGGSKGLHWVLDPIDGTRGFVGMRQYAVCLGLLHKGQVGAQPSGSARAHAV